MLSLFIVGDYLAFKRMMGGSGRFSMSLYDMHPFIFDKTAATRFDRHYVYHTAWAARKVREINPEFHIDISSSLYFSSIVSAFVPVKFYDYRPADLNLSGLESGRCDLSALPFADDSVGSISCMHTVEHVGLGRYGDSIDPDGDIKAIRELKRVVARGGFLIFVVPVGGKPMIEFNAHRVYSYEQVLSYFSDFELKEFSLIPEYGEKGGIVANATKEMADKEKYGCGCFLFIKH